MEYLSANWTATTIDWPNQKFVQPTATPWIRFSVVEGESTQITIGTTQEHRVPGIIIIQMFMPKDSGSKTLDGYMDTLDGLFTSKRIGIINCRSVSKSPVGIVGEWYQVNARIPFWFDRTITL